jgi:2-oxo-3-hexenedioate decarboxylase
MAQMGVSEIIVGQLTDAMRVAAGAEVELRRFIHPRIEPEVAYRLSRDVDDSVSDLATCVDAIAAGLEIIDSRYRDFRFDLPGVIADNASAAGFVIGEWQPFGLDAGDLDVRLVVDGAVAELGSTSDILGNPANALPALLRMARRYRLPLRGGDVVLAGAATGAIAFTASTVQAQIPGLGTATVHGVG